MIDKILTGEKKIESRWYSSRRAPWDKIKANDTVYFKNSGEPVSLKTRVSRVLQFCDLTPWKVREILKDYGAKDGIALDDLDEFYKILKDKKYCILVFLKNPQKINPFSINKRGFGAMAAWICAENLKNVKG